MKNESPKNHYRGLVAQWYDRLLENEKKDIEYYRSVVQECSGSVLELACGTGRLLVPYLRAGADIEGLDISGDMLKICRNKLKNLNLTTKLYEQDIAEFSTKKQYDTIFIAGGSFQLLDNFDRAMSCLSCIHDHLQTDGRLALDLFPLWAEARSSQDGAWQLGRTAQNDKGETLYCHAATEWDYPRQIQKGHFKYELYRNGRLAATIIDDMNLRWYGRQEFVMMLEKAGFTSISTETADLMSTHGESTVYLAHREKSV
jgi:SAM-dependent methyltransferase